MRSSLLPFPCTVHHLPPLEVQCMALSKWYRSERFSDLRISIAEEQDEQLKILDVFPAHRLVIYEGSEHFKAKFDSLSKEGSCNAIVLLVPPGQLDTGQLLVQCMYNNPNFRMTEIPQQQLVELLILADAYQAPKIAAAAADKLGSKSVKELDWQVVAALYELHSLHSTVEALPGYAAALKTGATKLRALLGDLDAAWASDSSAACLRELPFRLLLQLLHDPDTRAASEDTVVYTIDQWLKARVSNSASGPGVTADNTAGITEEQVALLVEHIRLPRCSLLYLTTVVPFVKWLVHHIPVEQLPVATALAVLPSVGPVRQALQGHSKVLDNWPAWKLPSRPASAVRMLQLDLIVPVQQLRQMVNSGLQAADGNMTAAGAIPGQACMSNEAVWCGQRFRLQLEFSARQLAVGLLMEPALDSGDIAYEQRMTQQLASVQCSLCAMRYGVHEVCRKADRPRTLVAGSSRKWADFFSVGEIRSWQQLLAGLEKHRLMVDARGMHIRALINKIW